MVNTIRSSVPVFPTHSITKGPRLPVRLRDQPSYTRDGSDTARKDVLVVDDEPYLCDLIADVLEAEGHTARKASHGLEALERVREHKPDLILLDLMMPIMDGWEFVQALRAMPQFASIPVVVITAHYQIGRTQQELNARAIITKPFDIDQIGEVVRTYAS